jgi:hypothetical protein
MIPTRHHEKKKEACIFTKPKCSLLQVFSFFNNTDLLQTQKISFYNIPFTYIPKTIIGLMCVIERIRRLRGDKVSFASHNQSPQPILTLS